MKLRLLDDSIRLRLSQSEVLAAHGGGAVEGRTRFPDGSSFVFALQTAAGGARSAAYGEGRMVVSLPAAEVDAWAEDDTAVSIRAELPLADGAVLKLLVEKDFQCVTPRGDEDQSDLFPHPEAGC